MTFSWCSNFKGLRNTGPRLGATAEKQSHSFLPEISKAPPSWLSLDPSEPQAPSGHHMCHPSVPSSMLFPGLSPWWSHHIQGFTYHLCAEDVQMWVSSPHRSSYTTTSYIQLLVPRLLRMLHTFKISAPTSLPKTYPPFCILYIRIQHCYLPASPASNLRVILDIPHSPIPTTFNHWIL